MMDIYVLNENLQREYIIRKYQSLTWTTAFQEAGNFELKVGYDLFKLFVDWEDLDKTIFIENTDDDWHVGVVENVEKIEEEESSKYITIKGRMAEGALLMRRVPEYAMTFAEVYSAVAIGDLLDNTIINPENVNRKMSQVIYNSSGLQIGDRVSVECGNDNYVYEHIKTIVNNAKIGFRGSLTRSQDMTQSFIEIIPYEGVDRSLNNDPSLGIERIVVGQRRGSAQRIEFYADFTTRGTAVVGRMSGEEIGSPGKTILYPEGLSEGGVGLRRWERPVDLSDLSRTFEDEDGVVWNISEANLEKNGENLMKAFLEKSKPKMYVTGKLPEPMQRAFREKFNLGDIVTVIDDETGFAADSTVLNAQEVYSIEGYSISVDIGERSPVTDEEGK